MKGDTVVTIGNMFHVIHMYDELQPLDDWYDRIFAPRRSMLGNYSETEKRDASLCYISDFCMETMAPAHRVAGAGDMPVGRFHRRFGNHLHSIAWFVSDGMPELFGRLQDAGVRLFTDGGGAATDISQLAAAAFTHPRDTKCQWELMAATGDQADPTARIEGWSVEFWRDEHPMGILPSAWHITVSARDLDEGAGLYERLLGGRVVHEEEDAAKGTRSRYLGVGENTLIEVATPTGSDGLLARDLDSRGEIIHAVTFRTRDLAAARQHVLAQGVGVEEVSPETFLISPDDSMGAILYISERAIPGDPR